jgi:hypothetical protein
MGTGSPFPLPYTYSWRGVYLSTGTTLPVLSLMYLFQLHSPSLTIHFTVISPTLQSSTVNLAT